MTDIWKNEKLDLKAMRAEREAERERDRFERSCREKFRKKALETFPEIVKELKKISDKRKKLHKKYEEDMIQLGLQLGAITSVLYSNGIQLKEIAEALDVKQNLVHDWKNKGDRFFAIPE